MSATPRTTARPAPLGWRVLAMIYDALPVLALWFVVSVATLLLRRGHPIAPWTAAFWLQNLVLWIVAGLYAVESWRRGGQTLGMRPWRLRVVADDGGLPSRAQLWRRYAVATLSLVAVGLGFLWSLFESDSRAWHDLWSGTRLVRLEKN